MPTKLSKKTRKGTLQKKYRKETFSHKMGRNHSKNEKYTVNIKWNINIKCSHKKLAYQISRNREYTEAAGQKYS